MMKKLSLLFFLLVVFKAEQSYGQFDHLDTLFSNLESSPGMSVAVFKDGKYVYNKSFGLSNLDHQIPISNQTNFEIGGLAMHFTAACILKLEDDGKLKLGDPVSTYLSDFPEYQEGEVTIKHLLHHTSGLMDYIIALDMSGHPWEKSFNNEEAYELFKKGPKLGFTPGQEYEFGFSNYMVLARIVETVSGKDLDEFAKSELFEPLGMSGTTYMTDADKVISNRAIGYTKDGETFKVNHYYNFASAGDGRLYTNMNDLMIWSEAWNNDTHPVRNIDERIPVRGVLNNGNEIDYALGMDHGVEKGYPFYGHSGYWAGSSAMLLKVPDADFWVLTLGNDETNPAPGMAYQILDIVLEENPNRPTPAKTVKISRKQKEQYTGDYITYKNGYLRNVFVRNDTLFYAEVSGREFPLRPIGKDLFKVIGTITDYSIKFDLTKGRLKEMTFMRNGVPGFSYTEYSSIGDQVLDVDQIVGTYRNTDLGITYELKKEEGTNTIATYSNGKKVMNYSAVMPDIFCSESTHHGYMRFNTDYNAFTLSDYSFKPIYFEKID